MMGSPLSLGIEYSLIVAKNVLSAENKSKTIGIKCRSISTAHAVHQKAVLKPVSHLSVDFVSLRSLQLA